MDTHFDILIDASGSMGDFKGDDGVNYLLPDKSTRTDLVKKILINSIIPKLQFTKNIDICTFRKELIYNEKKELIVDITKPLLKNIYNGFFNKDLIINAVSNIENPEIGGTPLFSVLFEKIEKRKNKDLNIIILSDGDANDNKNFDKEILKKIKSENINCKIYFIGISQNEEAQFKSKNLTNETNGFYVNIEAINYKQDLFDSFLFDFNTTITADALKESLKIQPSIVENITEKKVEVKKELDTIEEVKSESLLEKEVEPSDIKSQVAENTKSLQLISSQLDQIVKQISFMGNHKSREDDEFLDNEDEEFNKLIGFKTERILFEVLKSKWKDTTWLNENGEQGNPYDFEVIFEGQTYFMECKGTVTNLKEFFLTKNEWLFYLANRGKYRLYFVSNINSQNPLVHRIEDLLKDIEEGKLIPCSSINRKVKADRILFQII